MIGPVHRITSEVGTKYIENDHFQTREDEDDKARELKFLPTGAEFQGAVRKFHDFRADGIMNTLLRQTSALSGDEKTKNIPEGKQDQKDTTDHINKNIQGPERYHFDPVCRDIYTYHIFILRKSEARHPTGALRPALRRPCSGK